MRRWMIVLTIVGLFVAVMALPGATKQKEKTQQPPVGQEFFLFDTAPDATTFGAVEARTGEWAGDSSPFPYPVALSAPCPGTPNLPTPPAQRGGYIAGVPGWCQLMDPNYNTCDVAKSITVGVGAEATTEWTTLTWTGKNTAELTTYEVNCPLFADKMPRVHTRVAHITPGGRVTLSGDPHPFFPDVDDKHWLVDRSGCGLNGTFPVYHGTFDWEKGHLYAETHFHGICDGGTSWWKFGIGSEDGPLHATFTIDLTFNMDY